MRTELALAALGFVSVITLSSLFSNLGDHRQNKVLIDTVSGSVGWGNFSYWKLSQQGALSLVLTTIEGDADLYVSEKERPSYEADRNNFTSATCGLDTVDVPATFPRPISIGVFGHWSHEKSDYIMHVFLEADNSEGLPVLKTPPARERSTPQKKASTESPLLLGILSVLDVLVEMFMV